MKKKKKLVSIVIPSYNTEAYIGKVLSAITAQNYPKNLIEIIIVDDNSTDKTIERAKKFKKFFKHFRIIVKNKKLRKGAAVSTNLGFKAAKGELVCSIDSDAIISRDWIPEIVKHFEDPTVAMVAGYIKTGNPEFLVARFMGAELEDRYDQIKQKEVDHVSTCNTAYRKSVIEEVKGFDESLYYGYDTDFSYKIKRKGYKILLIKNVGCLHYWKNSFMGYLKQQFDVAYARMALIRRHPGKVKGDRVAGIKLFIQVPLFLLFFIAIMADIILGTSFLLSSIILLTLILIQVPQTIRIILKKQDPAFLMFPFFLLIRNFVWTIAFGIYILRSFCSKCV